MSYHSDAPRPPVPGEEGDEGGRFSSKTPSDWSECAALTPRRSDLDLGFEPEGSASLDGPYEPWAESLLALLGDREGTALFQHFLRPLGCSPLLEFWFACSGFQKLPEGAAGRRLRLAKAMYRCYLCPRSGGGGVVARTLTAQTRGGVRDAIQRLQLDSALSEQVEVEQRLDSALFEPAQAEVEQRLDSALFEPAQAEVEQRLQDHLFPLFLRSDLYLEHTAQSPGLQKTPQEGGAKYEPEKETPPPHTAANQRRPIEHRQERHAWHRRHTHLPHTPVKMTPHSFAAELMRRLQDLQTQNTREDETVSSRRVTVVYYYSGEAIPYRTCVSRDPAVTLGRFKSLLTRRGPFRFFFQSPSTEFPSGAVFQEIRQDYAILPTFEHKIIARVEEGTAHPQSHDLHPQSHDLHPQSHDLHT